MKFFFCSKKRYCYRQVSEKYNTDDISSRLCNKYSPCNDIGSVHYMIAKVFLSACYRIDDEGENERSRECDRERARDKQCTHTHKSTIRECTKSNKKKVHRKCTRTAHRIAEIKFFVGWYMHDAMGEEKTHNHIIYFEH